ncbi:hypothetical protein [Saccharothrix deserti]|uniref:hypothetical protein n=1 Tax=Saccharothrix deserti TaxID=2593674 RepID=UPI00131B0C74|nr:hypothetical protein [Saccharothrix deserti]
MTHPGAPQHYPQPGQYPQHQPQFPQQGQQYGHPQQGQHYPQQYLGGPPPRRGNKAGVVIGVLAVVLVLGLAFAGYWVFFEMDDSADARPAVDASQDLEKAPIGCAMFDEAEVAPHIPGRMDYEEGSANPGVGESYDQGQCMWNNPDFIKEKVRPSHVIVTSYVYHANMTMSGVDRAKEHLERRVRTGVAVNVKGADDALLVEQRKVDWTVELVVRYHNVVYSVVYANQTDGANVKGGATALATIAIGKVVPDED